MRQLVLLHKKSSVVEYKKDHWVLLVVSSEKTFLLGRPCGHGGDGERPGAGGLRGRGCSRVEVRASKGLRLTFGVCYRISFWLGPKKEVFGSQKMGFRGLSANHSEKESNLKSFPDALALSIDAERGRRDGSCMNQRGN